MGFSTDIGFDAQRNSAEALWPPTFGAAIFDFDGTLAATEGLWEEVDRIFFGQRGIEYDAWRTRRWRPSALRPAPSGFARHTGWTSRRPTSATSGTAWGMPSTRHAWSSDPVRGSTWPH